MFLFLFYYYPVYVLNNIFALLNSWLFQNLLRIFAGALYVFMIMCQKSVFALLYVKLFAKINLMIGYYARET